MSSTADDRVDLISSLPDEILSHILSFLKTEQAVVTGILSKRWKHVWRSVPIIKFKTSDECDKLLDEYDAYRFSNFVNSVLLSRGSNSIKSFSLEVQYDSYDTVGFTSLFIWINHVVRCSAETIESIDLTVGFHRPSSVLPNSLFSCRTLVVLKLKGFGEDGLPPVTLPSLKNLQLEDFLFKKARDLMLLLAGCPILEDLYTHSVDSKEDSSAYQDCVSLSKLTKAKMPETFSHFPLKMLCNVKELYIEINQVYRRRDEIPTFHNLTNLTLYSIHYNWPLLFQVLNHCPNLQILKLSQVSGRFGGYYKVQDYWLEPIIVPQCLSLHVKTCELWYFEELPDEFQLAIYILNNAKVLQTMKFYCSRILKDGRQLSLCSKASPTCELLFYLLG